MPSKVVNLRHWILEMPSHRCDRPSIYIAHAVAEIVWETKGSG